LVSSPEGATISINDSLINEVTPVTLQNLLPGSYTVKFGLYNHRDKELLVAVESSKTNTFAEALRDTSVWVDYQVFNSGIQTNSLTAITVDQNNIKWIGTLDRGLIKYDELNFESFNVANSLIPDNRINCLSVDPQNRIWAGTDFGIGIFNGSSWTVYNRNNSGLTAEIINTIEFDENGNAWIGTTANLVKFDGINWTVYNEPSGWGDWINAMYIESENNIIYGSKLNGIYEFIDGNFNKLSQPIYGYPSTTISSIDVDAFDNLWFAFLPDTTGGGAISTWDGNTFTNTFIGSPQINVNQIFIDELNNKWIATSEGFIVYDAQNNSTYFRTNNSLITSNITKACVSDLNGNIWITTFASGLNKYKPLQ
jgi:ligand-binding sensor domain-containing protein